MSANRIPDTPLMRLDGLSAAGQTGSTCRSYTMILAGGQHPLDAGTLYVARFGDDGTGEWLPLVHGQGPLTTENGWTDQAEILVFARGAADALGATKMDRPEWGTIDPVTGHVYMTMTTESEASSRTSP